MTVGTRLSGRWLTGRWLWGLAVAVALSAAALVWTGYRAVREWREAANMVAVRRTQAAADLLAAALARDMRGAQLDLQTSLALGDPSRSSASDLLHPVASAFARYPYIEAFFWWDARADPGAMVFFTRTERQPPWLSSESRSEHVFPVAVWTHPGIGGPLIERIGRDATQARTLSVFERDFAGAHYQVVTQISYFDRWRERPSGDVGFLVDLDWVRRHYFTELAAQLEQIADPEAAIEFVVLDDRGQPVGHSDDEALSLLESAPQSRRDFPLAFFDPIDLTIDPPPDLRLSSWTAVALARDEPTLIAAERGARRTLWISAAMALALTGGVLLSLQAARTRTRLADMRADFVSAITHELKTPIANLRAINETIASGRSTPVGSREYAQMGIREANRLSRLVNNLLAYSRVTDVADVYAFEPVAIDTVVNRALQEFSLNLQAGGFDVASDIPEDLPPVLGDTWALDLMLNNLIDNAIRYSTTSHELAISARNVDGNVVLKVADRGVGIPDAELRRVRRRFVRGRAPVAAGTGLGLTIVDRIVSDHGGSLAIDSTPGVGTTVAVTLRVAS